MERETSSLKNLLGLYNPSNYTPEDPSMNVSVHSSGASKLSPFLAVNPYVSTEPEFILPDGSNKSRGRLEYAFGSIGGSVLIGAGGGGILGLYKGLQDTKALPIKVRRTQLINYIGKRGASSGNALGVMALMYSGFGVFLSWMRETDDEINTLAAATATGLLFKSTSGLRRCAMGGGIGFALAAVYCLWTRGNKDRSIVNYIGTSRYSNY
jgi:import inner membrane translocase subunit TIM23